MTTLSDYQVMYGDLLMGPGTPFDIAPGSLGFLDVDGLRTSDTERARGDGSWTGEEYASAQTFPLSLEIYPGHGLSLPAAVRAFLDATTPRTPRELWFKLPFLEEERVLLGVRVRRRHVPIDMTFGRLVKAEIDLFAPDPARYGPEMQLKAVVGIRPRVSGVNQGSLDSWARFYLSHPQGIDGPVTIRHLETGSRISIDTRTGPGEVLVIDQEIGTAVVDYVSDRSTALTARQWWTVSPGASFTVELEAPAGTSMDVGWRASWW